MSYNYKEIDSKMCNCCNISEGEIKVYNIQYKETVLCSKCYKDETCPDCGIFNGGGLCLYCKEENEWMR